MEDKRQKIIEAASLIIIEKGVENTTLSEIAKQVGISKGTLYYYYPSKKDLILEVAEFHLNKITVGLIHLTENMAQYERPEEMLKKVFESIIKDNANDKLHLNLIEEAITHHDVLQEKFRVLYKEWRSIIKEGLKKVMQGSSHNYEALATVIITCLDGLIVQHLIGVKDIHVNHIANYLLNPI